jgi:hypothetical protein
MPRKFGYRVIAKIEVSKLEIDVERARRKRAADLAGIG